MTPQQTNDLARIIVSQMSARALKVARDYNRRERTSQFRPDPGLLFSAFNTSTQYQDLPILFTSVEIAGVELAALRMIGE